MFESMIVMFQKFYFVAVLLAILCIFGIWHRKGFIASIILTSLFALSFAWSVWYIDNGDWWRTGKPMEGVTASILGFLGWVVYLSLTLLLGLLKAYLCVREDGKKISRGFFEGAFWVSLTVVLYSVTSRWIARVPVFPSLFYISLWCLAGCPFFFVIKTCVRLGRKLWRWSRKAIYRCRVKLYQLLH